MKTDYTLIDNTARQRYEMEVEGHTAYVEYTLNPGTITLTHTLVPKALEGQGVGSALVRLTLEEVRRKGLKVIPDCDFIAIYIHRHPEWEELIIKKAEKA